VNNITDITKRITAGLLVALVFTVTVVKFFHSCDEHAYFADENGMEQVSDNVKCAICEFHLTNDVVINMEVPSIDAPVFHSNIIFASYSRFFPSSVGLSFSDRGPPSLL
jgi:hypothetical protein